MLITANQSHMAPYIHILGLFCLTDPFYCFQCWWLEDKKGVQPAKNFCFKTLLVSVMKLMC